jgi:phosphohistidine phosphatase
MQIYLLRHGIAEDGRPGHADSERALTNEGRKKVRDVLTQAREAGVAPTMILSSPYRRAVQTAAIAADVFAYKEELLRTSVLEPGAAPRDAWEEIRVHKGEDQLLLVGHEPLFSSLGAFLLGSPTLLIDFKKGAVLRIDLEQFGPQPRGKLKWMLVTKLTPRKE